MNQLSAPVKILIYLLLGIAIIFILIVAKDFLIPITFGILFAYLLYPLAHRMESWGIPRIPTNIILILLLLALIAGVVIGLGTLISGFADDLGDIKKNLQRNLYSFELWIEDTFGVAPYKQEEEIKKAANQWVEQSGDTMQKLFTTTAGTIVKILLLPVYIFIFLFFRDKAKKFIYKATPSNQDAKIKSILEQISDVAPRYLGGIAIVVTILAVINSLGFWIIGVDYPILFGVVAAIINFIPYLGTILGYLLVLLFVLATQEPVIGLYVIIMFIIVQFTENNILTPNITGSLVSINAGVTIISIIVSSMIWGFAGMFVIIPVLAIIKIICDHVEPLKPIGFLMSERGTEKHALNFGYYWQKIKNGFK